MRTIECIILEKEGSKNGLRPHLDAPGQKSVKNISIAFLVHLLDNILIFNLSLQWDTLIDYLIWCIVSLLDWTVLVSWFYLICTVSLFWLLLDLNCTVIPLLQSNAWSVVFYPLCAHHPSHHGGDATIVTVWLWGRCIL